MRLAPYFLILLLMCSFVVAAELSNQDLADMFRGDWDDITPNLVPFLDDAWIKKMPPEPRLLAGLSNVQVAMLDNPDQLNALPDDKITLLDFTQIELLNPDNIPKLTTEQIADALKYETEFIPDQLASLTSSQISHSDNLEKLGERISKLNKNQLTGALQSKFGTQASFNLGSGKPKIVGAMLHNGEGPTINLRNFNAPSITSLENGGFKIGNFKVDPSLEGMELATGDNGALLAEDVSIDIYDWTSRKLKLTRVEETIQVIGGEDNMRMRDYAGRVMTFGMASDMSSSIVYSIDGSSIELNNVDMQATSLNGVPRIDYRGPRIQFEYLTNDLVNTKITSTQGKNSVLAWGDNTITLPYKGEAVSLNVRYGKPTREQLHSEDYSLFFFQEDTTEDTTDVAVGYGDFNLMLGSERGFGSDQGVQPRSICMSLDKNTMFERKIKGGKIDYRIQNTALNDGAMIAEIASAGSYYQVNKKSDGDQEPSTWWGWDTQGIRGRFSALSAATLDLAGFASTSQNSVAYSDLNSYFEAEEVPAPSEPREPPADSESLETPGESPPKLYTTSERTNEARKLAVSSPSDATGTAAVNNRNIELASLINEYQTLAYGVLNTDPDVLALQFKANEIVSSYPTISASQVMSWTPGDIQTQLVNLNRPPTVQPPVVSAQLEPSEGAGSQPTGPIGDMAFDEFRLFSRQFQEDNPNLTPNSQEFEVRFIEALKELETPEEADTSEEAERPAEAEPTGTQPASRVGGLTHALRDAGSAESWWEKRKDDEYKKYSTIEISKTEVQDSVGADWERYYRGLRADILMFERTNPNEVTDDFINHINIYTKINEAEDQIDKGSFNLHTDEQKANARAQIENMRSLLQQKWTPQAITLT